MPGYRFVGGGVFGMSSCGSPVDIGPLRCVHFWRECCFERGGVATAVLDLCAVLAERGHQVTLLTFDATDVPEPWLQDHPNGPTAIEIERSRFARTMLSRRSMRIASRAIEHADIVHLHTPWGPSNLQVARTARAAHLPYVVTPHGMLDDWSMKQNRLKKKTFLATVGRRFLESAARIHFTAESELAQATRWIPAAGDRCSIVPLIVDLTAFQHLPGPEPALAKYPAIDSGKRSILFLSRLHPKKGIEFLIEAAAMLANNSDSFQVLIAGPGDPSYVESLRQLVAKHALADRIHFLGMVRGADKLSLFQLADVFVLPTHQENFGVVLVEALASGTPVVTTRGTDIWQELQTAGALIAARTAESLAAAIGPLLEDPRRGHALGRQGREHVLRWLARDRLASRYEQLYGDAIGRGPVGRGANRR